MRYENFIFDMDGTIVDTLSDIANSVNYALSCLQVQNRTMEEIKSFIGNGSKMLIKRALGKRQDLFDTCFSIYYQRYLDNYCVDTQIYPHLLDALIIAKKRGIRLFIYTNKPQALASNIVEKLFPANLFSLTLGVKGELVKPDPNPFFKASESFKIDYSKTCYFGDSTTDLSTAKNLNCKARFSVLWGYQSLEKLKSFEIKADGYLQSAEEIGKIAQLD